MFTSEYLSIAFKTDRYEMESYNKAIEITTNIQEQYLYILFSIRLNEWGWNRTNDVSSVTDLQSAVFANLTHPSIKQDSMRGQYYPQIE